MPRASFSAWPLYLCLGLCCTGCAREGQENMGLSAVAVDLTRLDRPEALVRALLQPGRALDGKLGPHRLVASSSIRADPPPPLANAAPGLPLALDETLRLDA